jgi:YidC/Oxa1 family membrane protein insertase
MENWVDVNPEEIFTVSPLGLTRKKEDMDRRTLLTMALCFLVFFGWQKFYIEPRTPKSRPGTTGVTQSPTQSAKTPQVANASSSLPNVTPTVAPQIETITVPGAKIGLSNGITAFSSWILENYREVDLAQFSHQDLGELTLAFDSPEFASLSQARASLSPQSDGSGYGWVYEDSRVKIRRQIQMVSSSQATVRFDIDFKTEAKPKFAFVSINSKAMTSDPDYRDRQVVYWDGIGVHRESIEENTKLVDIAAPVKWIATSSRYFLLAILNDQDNISKGLIFPKGPYQAQASLVYPVAGSSLSIPLQIYFGPKELNQLKAVDPTLQEAVDFGWFGVLAGPMLRVMKQFHAWVGNWGFAIILLTILVRIIVFPLMYKSAAGMKKMAKIQPELQKLKEKHKDNPQKLNQEMIELMKTQGYNPMSGCLPLLVQMPVFFALYRVLYNSIELYQAPFGLWIHDLSIKDPYYVTPILLTGVMFLQQKLTPTTITDPVQAKVFQWMPVIFGVFMISLPAGLTVYMLTNAIVGIFQQMYLNKKLDLRPQLATQS